MPISSPWYMNGVPRRVNRMVMMIFPMESSSPWAYLEMARGKSWLLITVVGHKPAALKTFSRATIFFMIQAGVQWKIFRAALISEV